MPRRKKGNPINGWINYYKPVGVSSAGAVNFVRWAFGAQKAGHGGTLDPLAEGVLPIGLGEATKVLPYMLEGDKFYRFEMTFGSETDTDDAEGETSATSERRPTQSELEQALNTFTGEIDQVPPVYSALKIDGKRACDRVRAGETVVMKPRKITIYNIDLEEFSETKATLHVHVSKGTYVRSLARDIGRQLGCLAHVTRLIRTKHGVFDEKSAVCKKELEKMKELGQTPETLLQDVDIVLDDIPEQTLTPAEVELLLRGMPVQTELPDHEVIRMKNESGTLVSIASIAEGQVQAKRNFPALVNVNDIEQK